MKKYIKIFACAVFLLTVSCSKSERLYDFGESQSPLVTFQSKKLNIPDLTEDNNGTFRVPLYRGNVKDEASVAFTVSGGEGVFTPTTDKFKFAAGENVAYVEFEFDFTTLDAKPITISLSIENDDDVASNGIKATSFSVVRKLTYKSIGKGSYYSALFGEEWPQDILKAEEGPYYSLPDCWISGVSVNFSFNGTGFELYTVQPGYNYGSYGPVELSVQNFVYDSGKLTITAEYFLPELNNYSLGTGVEILTFPEGFSIQ